MNRLAMIIVSVLFFSGLLIIIPRLFGFYLLPSVAYAESARPYAMVVAALGGLASFYLFAFTAELNRGRARLGKPPASIFKRLALAFGVSILVFASGFIFVMGTIPFTIALFRGAEVSHVYTVERVPSFGSRHCREKVELTRMPLFFDEVCGVPQTTRARLKPGDTVSLVGRGTALGLFVDRIRIER